MAIWDAFTPEGLLRAMGVNPAEMLAEYQRLSTEFAEVKTRVIATEAAIMAMPAGVKSAVDYFGERMKKIEGTQARTEETINAIFRALNVHGNGQANTLTTGEKRNGHDKNAVE